MDDAGSKPLRIFSRFHCADCYTCGVANEDRPGQWSFDWENKCPNYKRLKEKEGFI
jgi:hypothetical protein